MSSYYDGRATTILRTLPRDEREMVYYLVRATAAASRIHASPSTLAILDAVMRGRVSQTFARGRCTQWLLVVTM
jgi:hypothetical protein